MPDGNPDRVSADRPDGGSATHAVLDMAYCVQALCCLQCNPVSRMVRAGGLRVVVPCCGRFHHETSILAPRIGPAERV